MKLLNQGQIINDRYLLVQQINQSTYNEVWLAFDQMLQTNVTLRCYIRLDEDGITELKSSYLMTQDYIHPNLVISKHFDTWESRPFVVLKYYRQGNARALAGRVDEDVIWRFIHDIASGLAYIHKQHFAALQHNFKLSNVMIDDDGHFLLSDYGLSAKSQQILYRQSGNTYDPEVMPYMGPERFEDAADAVKASDVWALGSAIYMLATGAPIFAGKGGSALMQGAPIPSLNSAIWSADLNNLMAACLAKQTWDRPLASDIAKYAQGKIENRTTTQPEALFEPAPAYGAPTSPSAPNFGAQQPFAAPYSPQPQMQSPQPADSGFCNNEPPTHFDANSKPLDFEPTPRPFSTERPFSTDSSSTSSSPSNRRRRPVRKASTIEQIVEYVDDHKKLFLWIIIALVAILGSLIVLRFYFNTQATNNAPEVEEVTTEVVLNSDGYSNDVPLDTPDETPLADEAPKTEQPESTTPAPAPTKEAPQDKPEKKAATQQPNKAPQQETTDRQPTKSNDNTAAHNTDEKPKSSQKEKTTKGSQAERLSAALASGNNAALKTLADEGYGPAAGKYAEVCLRNKLYDEADKYARKAKAAGDPNGAKVISDLEILDYYE